MCQVYMFKKGGGQIVAITKDAQKKVPDVSKVKKK